MDTLPDVPDADDAPAVRVPCLTVLSHSRAEMVGARALMPQLLERRVVGLSRLTPPFQPLQDAPPEPLGDPYVSRQPALLSWQDGVVLTPPAGETRLLVGGQPVVLPRHIDRDGLERGVVLEMSNRTALLLHMRTEPQRVAPCGLVGGSELLDAVRQQTVRAAAFDVPVLVTGETGVGKELVARALHDASPRRDGPWVAINVAEIKAETAASVLFGHVRGAFTGASQDHDGLFVRADGGTLFLDEIGEMAPDVQAMLLRVLETGEVQRLGDRRLRKVSVRVVAATDQDLDERGPLRTPLLYRLAGYHLRVPPLRQRPEDIGTLCASFRDHELVRVGQLRGSAWIPAALMTQLIAHKWPGNARELRNLVRTLVIQADGDERLGRGFSVAAWLDSLKSATPRPRSGADQDPNVPNDTAVAAALARNHWNLTATARDLGIARSTLYVLIERSTTLRTASTVTRDELQAAWDRVGGDIDAMAQLLRVSPRGLRLALRAAGLGEHTTIS